MELQVQFKSFLLMTYLAFTKPQDPTTTLCTGTTVCFTSSIICKINSVVISFSSTASFPRLNSSSVTLLRTPMVTKISTNRSVYCTALLQLCNKFTKFANYQGSNLCTPDVFRLLSGCSDTLNYKKLNSFIFLATTFICNLMNRFVAYRFAEFIPSRITPANLLSPVRVKSP